MDQVVELEIPARPEYVGLVRLVISSVAADRRNLDGERVADLKLAVSEACTNAVEAQDATTAVGRVVVRCFEDDSRFEVQVDDFGRGFDLAAIPTHQAMRESADLDRESGLGIPLIHALVDEVEFRSSSKGTSVRMVLRCGRAGSNGAAHGAESAKPDGGRG